MPTFTRHKHIRLLTGQAIPAILAVGYGLVIWLESPWHVRLAFGLIGGGLTSIVFTEVAIVILFRWTPRTPARRLVGTAALVVPYAFALFLVVYLGLYEGWYSLTEFHGIGQIINAAVWLLAGLRMLVVLFAISQHDMSWSGLYEEGVAEQLSDTEEDSSR